MTLKPYYKNRHITLYLGDCMEVLPQLEGQNYDAMVTDPPYNIGVKELNWDKFGTGKRGKVKFNEWFIGWFRHAYACLNRPWTAFLFYGKHDQFAPFIMRSLEPRSVFVYRETIIWHKLNFKTNCWKCESQYKNLNKAFGTCEYIAHFSSSQDTSETTPEAVEHVQWLQGRCKELGISYRDIAIKYKEQTGREANMLRHYFSVSQTSLPTREIWAKVFVPLGFGMEEWEERRAGRNSLNLSMTPNPWYDAQHIPENFVESVVDSTNSRRHPCQKPLDLCRRLVLSCVPPGGTVLDPFCGSGAISLAASQTGRQAVTVENDERTAELAAQWFEANLQLF